MFGRLTEGARNIISFAREEAIRLHAQSISSEHVLLGMILEERSVAFNILSSLGVNLENLRREVEKHAIQKDSIRITDPPFTPMFNKAMESAAGISSAFSNAKTGSSSIGTEHILIGILQDVDSLARKVLSGLDVQVEDIRHGLKPYLSDAKPKKVVTLENRPIVDGLRVQVSSEELQEHILQRVEYYKKAIAYFTSRKEHEELSKQKNLLRYFSFLGSHIISDSVYCLNRRDIEVLEFSMPGEWSSELS